MKNLLLITVLTLSTLASLSAARIFVAPSGDAAQDGNSWATATSLEHALSQANRNDEIWVKTGTYTLAVDAPRTASFVLKPGVRLYGGFAGTESDLDQREAANVSVLSGERGNTETLADNLHTVVIMQSNGVDASILNGFTITGGSGRNFKDGLTYGSAGGGLYIMAGDEAVDHMVANCVFTNNKAHNGGAVLIDTGRPFFSNCTFRANKADFNGGAVYNKGTASVSNPIFKDCVFEENSSNSGAGITNNGTNGTANTLLIGCEFTDNTSLMNGAAIYNITNDNGETDVVIENCVFEGNDSILGDDVSDNGVSKPIAARAKRNGGGTLRPGIRPRPRARRTAVARRR